ncbi:hypothetical protein MTsPCn3_26520 [Erythrobacter sp. MTPC3]
MQPKPQSKMKTTSFISVAAARALYHACRFALPQGGWQSRNGCPPSNVSAPVALNLMVTIQWNLTKTGKDHFAELRNQRFCRWLRTRCEQLGISIAPHHAYAREKNHVHWLVHVPEQLVAEFKDLVPRWITSLEHKGKGSRIRAENHDPAPDGAVKIHRVRNSVAARKYLLKGISPRDAFRFGIKRVETQGVVVGRRTGVSRTLGRAARKRAGYKSQRPLWQRGNGRVVSSSPSIH